MLCGCHVDRQVDRFPWCPLHWRELCNDLVVLFHQACTTPCLSVVNESFPLSTCLLQVLAHTRFTSCAVLQSWVRRCSEISRRGNLYQNRPKSILLSEIRSKQCSVFEGKIGKSELSTVNSDFGESTELNTGTCDTESSFKAMRGLRRHIGKSELSTVNKGLEGQAGVVSSTQWLQSRRFEQIYGQAQCWWAARWGPDEALQSSVWTPSTNPLSADLHVCSQVWVSCFKWVPIVFAAWLQMGSI